MYSSDGKPATEGMLEIKKSCDAEHPNDKIKITQSAGFEGSKK